MIVLFTDFGIQGPYVGQLKGALASQAVTCPVIDLMHDAPTFDPQAASYLLAALATQFPAHSIFLAVVDPGVGDPARRPCLVQADGRWYVGPDNGLFNTVVKHAEDVQIWEILWRPEQLSNSFHGRDLFAPVAAELSAGRMPEARRLSVADMLSIDWPSELAKVIYIDHYGNAMTGLRGANIPRNTRLEINGHSLYQARTFATVPQDQAFWYINSCGLVEIAVNRGDAAASLEIKPGDTVVMQTV